MARRQYAFLIALIILSGLVGGALSSWLFTTQNVFAQTPRPVIVTEELQIVNSEGQIRGRLYVDDRGQAQLDLFPQIRPVQH